MVNKKIENPYWGLYCNEGRDIKDITDILTLLSNSNARSEINIEHMTKIIESYKEENKILFNNLQKIIENSNKDLKEYFQNELKNIENKYSTKEQYSDLLVKYVWIESTLNNFQTLQNTKLVTIEKDVDNNSSNISWVIKLIIGAVILTVLGTIIIKSKIPWL